MHPEFLQRTLVKDVPTEEIRNWSGLAHRVIELTGPVPKFGEEAKIVLWLHEDSAAGLLDMCDELDDRFATLEAENAKLREYATEAWGLFAKHGTIRPCDLQEVVGVRDGLRALGIGVDE